MADVKIQFSMTTERLLSGLEREWDVGVRTAARWAELSDYEQMVFIETWAIPRDYYHLLLERATVGELSAAQQTTFDALRWRIDATRAAIEAVLEDSAI